MILVNSKNIPVLFKSPLPSPNAVPGRILEREWREDIVCYYVALPLAATPRLKTPHRYHAHP
jgi:hypothetical protein